MPMTSNPLTLVSCQELAGKRQVLITLAGKYDDLVGPDVRQTAIDYAADAGVQRPAVDIGHLRPYGVDDNGKKIADLRTVPQQYYVDVIVNAGF